MIKFEKLDGWTSEELTTNSISIFYDGKLIAEVLADTDELTEDDRLAAQFIVDACNLKVQEDNP